MKREGTNLWVKESKSYKSFNSYSFKIEDIICIIVMLVTGRQVPKENKKGKGSINLSVTVLSRRLYTKRILFHIHMYDCNLESKLPDDKFCYLRTVNLTAAVYFPFHYLLLAAVG